MAAWSKHQVGDVELELFEGTVDDLVAEADVEKVARERAAELPSLPLGDPRVEAAVRLADAMPAADGIVRAEWLDDDSAWMLCLLEGAKDRAGDRAAGSRESAATGVAAGTLVAAVVTFASCALTVGAVTGLLAAIGVALVGGPGAVLVGLGAQGARDRAEAPYVSQQRQVAAIALGPDTEAKASLQEGWRDLRDGYERTHRLPKRLTSFSSQPPKRSCELDAMAELVQRERDDAAYAAHGHEGLDDMDRAVRNNR